jgi:hypothetical protein
LRAAAVQDLLELGLSDFMLESACSDEAGARLAQHRRRPPEQAGLVAEASPAYAARHGAQPSAYASRHSSPHPFAHLPVHSLPHPAPRGRQARHKGAGLPADIPDDLSFRAAKNRVVTAFERQYISSALARSSGNIAVASRAADKHRRAFWALMRKHQIDAAPFREAAEAADW